MKKKAVAFEEGAVESSKTRGGVKAKVKVKAGAPLRLCAHLFLLQQPNGAQ